MALYTKVSGTWRHVQRPFIKVSGGWRQIANTYIKVNNVWRGLYSFTWETGAYGSCDAVCGGGTMYRSVICRRSDGLAVADSVCTALVGTKPGTSASCNTQSCYTYSWSTGAWATCYCQGQSVSRSRTCNRYDISTGQTTSVAASYCPTPAPSTSATCASLGYNYQCAWSYTGWGPCSYSGYCGVGTMTRTEECRSTNGSAYIALSFCSTYVGSSTQQGTTGNCWSCTQCAAQYYSDAHVLQAKANKEGSTPQAMQAAILSAGFATVQAWWIAHGEAEKICPFSTNYGKVSTTAHCCSQRGFIWAVA